MGGKGSGGRRPGCGRKPKSGVEREITGHPGHRRGRVLPHPSVPAAAEPVPIEEFDAPDDLSFDERRVWLELAPFGFANRTLTKATALSFRLLCRNVVLERQYATSVTDRGGANHRGMIQRVDAELLRFNLSPCGKAMEEAGGAQPQRQASPLDRYTRAR